MIAEPRPLFRTEAVDAQRQQWLGGVQLARPLALTWITVAVLAILLTTVLFLSLAHYTRKATVAGVLAPDLGLIRLMPAAGGTVLERRVVEGQHVAAGAVLFVLALDKVSLAGDAQAAVRRSLDDRRRSLAEAARLQHQLASTRTAALDSRLRALDVELGQLDGEARLQHQRLVLADAAMARLQALQADNFISPAQTQSKAEELLSIRAAAQALSRQRAALLRDQAELMGERRAVPLLADSAVGGLERDLAQAARDSAEQDADQRLVVRAPQAGTISAVLAEPGQSVSAGSALAALVPAGAKLQAQLYAPSSAIGFVQTGQAVRLRYDAFPYQKFGQQPGHVLAVSRTPLAASDLAARALPAEGAGGEPLFRITVGLDDATDMPLAAGMRLQADVLLERRRLIEWLFEPLLGLGMRL